MERRELEEANARAPDTWFVPGNVKVCYEISFTYHFCKVQSAPSGRDMGGHPRGGEWATGMIGAIIGERQR